MNEETTISTAAPAAGRQPALLTVCQLGRLGDIVATEPAYRFLHERYPERRFRWYTRGQYVELLENAPFIDEVVTVENAAEYLERKAELPAGTLSFEFNFNDPRVPRAKRKKREMPKVFPSLLRQFSEAAGLNDVPDETPRFHFDPAIAAPALPAGYLVFHCASQGRSRQWPQENWRRLAEFCFARRCSVVEIGMEPMLESDSPYYVNLTGRQSLQRMARVIAGARLFVGVESGFGHIANATGVFGIILTGKLRSYPEYVTYSGRFRAGEKCNLVRFYGLPAGRLPYPVVEQVVERFLNGTPMSFAECDHFCLTGQIKLMRRNPGIVCAEWFRRPFDRIRNEWEISRRKRKAR